MPFDRHEWRWTVTFTVQSLTLHYAVNCIRIEPHRHEKLYRFSFFFLVYFVAKKYNFLLSFFSSFFKISTFEFRQSVSERVYYIAPNFGENRKKLGQEKIPLNYTSQKPVCHLDESKKTNWAQEQIGPPQINIIAKLCELPNDFHCWRCELCVRE